MKLSDFTTEELKQMKQACIDTRAKYDGYSDHQIPPRKPWCSLCDIYLDSYNGCRSCPHVVIDKSLGSYDEAPCEAIKYYKQKAMTRRKRLDRWIKLIDEEIRRRG